MKSYLQLDCLFFVVFFELGSACVQFCDVRDWGPWQPCNATCGSGVQIREKNICCDNARYPTLNQCLISCSIPFSVWQANATEQKVCGECQQGGTFNASQHRCDCPLGYEGSCCDALVIRKRKASARCIGKPCQNGTCIPIHGRFSCLCFAGYEGEKCHIDTDDCLKQPCLFGKCSDKINDFQCDCMVFFEGKTCNKLKPWAIAILALTALALLLICCCCFCCMTGKVESNDENEKEKRKRKLQPTSPRVGPTEKSKPQDLA